MPQTPLAETEPARRAFLPQLTRSEIMVVSAIVAVGLVLRVRLSLITYLNPDEAAHALNSFTGWREMFIYSYQVDKHPPLLMYMTHVILFFSRNDLAVRLIPILSGWLFPMLIGLWLARIAGKFAGMTALFLLTLTPHLVIVSAQLRTYTMSFLFLSASLVAFEIAIDTGRWPAMLAFDAFLFLSVCSDYSAAWFAGAVGIYALLRFGGSPSAVKITWAAGQLAPLIFYGALFVGNVRHIPASSNAENARIHWLSHGFPHANHMLRFPVVNTAQQFGFVMASLPLGIFAWAMFAAGIYFLWSDRTRLPREKARPLAVLFTLPFLLGIMGAYAKVFPYGATRQSVIIGIFGVAGVAVFLEFVPRPSRTILAGTAVVPILIWLLVPNPDKLDIPPWRNRKSQMLACLSYMHANIPPDARIFADRETLQMLMFYQGGRNPLPGTPSFVELPLADRWHVAVRDYQYSSQAQFRASLAAFRAQFGIAAKQPVWVLDGGFSVFAGPPDVNLPFTRAIRVFHTP
jgi:hypothetical protein